MQESLQRVVHAFLGWFGFSLWRWISFITGLVLGWVTYMLVGTNQLNLYFMLGLFSVATIVWVFMIQSHMFFGTRQSFLLSTSKMLAGYALVAGVLMRSGWVVMYGSALFASFIAAILIAKLVDLALPKDDSLYGSPR